ncbi:hypothetical protein NMM48_12385 [Acinetobacter baumannii]|uniref:hypothetical protein n=1 Tax=Acinetobacter baumannii TaxID=470 RepID=UPI0011A39FF0|nr:hypothetical protein [Acinetobacter baumannii]MCP9136121.1 hypothetical protein [Acinetobacter baumannii]TWO45069.1 hypothetical protein FQK04_13830 [Acinetobacter baumannii]
MENIVILFFNLLIIIALWNFLFRPAIKARKKVELYRVKKEVETFFSENKKYGKHHFMKKKLDDMLDSTISTLDYVSFSSYIAWQLQIDKNEEVKGAIQKEISEKYITKDEVLASFVDKIRTKSSTIGICYLIESSFVLLAFGLVYSTYFFIKEMIKKGKIQFTNLKPDVENEVEKIIKPEFISEKSFLLNTACIA